MRHLIPIGISLFSLLAVVHSAQVIISNTSPNLNGNSMASASAIATSSAVQAQTQLAAQQAIANAAIAHSQVAKAAAVNAAVEEGNNAASISSSANLAAVLSGTSAVFGYGGITNIDLSSPLVTSRLASPFMPDLWRQKCKGVKCQDITTGFIYCSCDQFYFGIFDGNRCGPNARQLSDCSGVQCRNPDGTVIDSCTLRSQGYDGYTCPLGSTPELPGRIQPFRPQLCTGVTCVHHLTGLEYTYNSCDLMGFGYDGTTCGLGFRPKGSCGPTYYNATCPSGSCCSGSGVCGIGSAYCNENSIQPPTSSTGRCGLGPFQPKCALGHCCSGNGFCGTGPLYCNARSLNLTTGFGVLGYMGSLLNGLGTTGYSQNNFQTLDGTNFYGVNAYSANAGVLGAYGANGYGPGAYGPGAYGPGAYGPGGYGPGGYGPGGYGPGPYGPGANGPGGYGLGGYGAGTYGSNAYGSRFGGYGAPMYPQHDPRHGTAIDPRRCGPQFGNKRCGDAHDCCSPSGWCGIGPGYCV